MIFAKFLHILGFIVWVGGMFFAYMALRPVAATRLSPEQRLPLWEGVFGKFFPWVWVAVGLLLGSGLFMMAKIGKPPVHVITMFASGSIMMVIFAYIVFSPYDELRKTVAAHDWPAAGAALGQIRKLIGINLILGLLTVAVGALGPLAV